MNLTELITEVYSITGRPDLVTRTLSAVKRATLRAHQREFFFRDIYEIPLVFDASAAFQQIEYVTLLPRYRAIKYLRFYDPTTDTPGKFLSPIEPDLVVDVWGADKTDIFYVAGSIIQIRALTAFQYLLAAFYLHPDITEGGFNSWIAREHPFAIVYSAAAEIFKATGKDEEFARMQTNVAEQDHMVDMTGLTQVGS